MSDDFTPMYLPFDPGANRCPECGEPRGVCRCDDEIRFSDGDKCRKCGSTNTERIDTICDDPIIWTCQCGACGEVFEVTTGWADEDEDDTPLPERTALERIVTDGWQHVGDVKALTNDYDKDSRIQHLLSDRNDMLSDEQKIHEQLALIDRNVDESVVVCVEGLVREFTELKAERDALKAPTDGYDGESLAGEIVRDRIALATAIGLTADDVLGEDIEVITERIAAIIAERDALKAALQPFADAYSVLDQLPDSDWACDVSGYRGNERAVVKLRVYQFEAAARALKADDEA